MPTKEQKFIEYHQNNPDVYEWFKKYAKQAQAAGRSKYSIWAIANRVRWHIDIETHDSNSIFKISNDYLAYYSRRLMKDVPELAGFFATKKMKNPPQQ